MKALSTSGLEYINIGRQLGISREKVRFDLRKFKNLTITGPKIVTYKGSINGKNSYMINAFRKCNPTATLQDIITACDLDVSPATLCTYLRRFGMPDQTAKSKL